MLRQPGEDKVGHSGSGKTTASVTRGASRLTTASSTQPLRGPRALDDYQSQSEASAGRGRRVGVGIKRGCDIALALMGLAVLSPLLALIALLVFVESPGPVLYRGRRVGRGGRRFAILKFRKMHHGATGPPLTLDRDARFTRIGGWLARSRLDELPQLVNVLRGDMSLIGPRPEDPAFVARHAEAFAQIAQIRPGITGLSQLEYAAESQMLDPQDPIGDYEERILPQKLQLDRLYATRLGPRIDVNILIWTVAATFLRVPVAVNRTTGRVSVRRGHGAGQGEPHPRRVLGDTDGMRVEGVPSLETHD